jgi:hypothetical protein
MVPLSVNVAKVKRRNVLAATLHITLLLLLVALVTFVVVENGRRFRDERSAGAGVVTLVAVAGEIGLLWHVFGAIWSCATSKPRVVPYFREKLFRKKLNRKASEESSKAFHRGLGIAADLSRLDDLARELHVTQLSSFGFGDDLLKQRPQWSDLAEGMRTVSALIERLEGDATSARVSATTLADLKGLAAVFGKAQESQTSFCLVVRHGRNDFISGYEMEKREGTFWC